MSSTKTGRKSMMRSIFKASKTTLCFFLFTKVLGGEVGPEKRMVTGRKQKPKIMFTSYFNSSKNTEKRQKGRSRKSKEGLREISKLLASNGSVAGKGEKIEKKRSKKKVEKLDAVTQVDSLTIEFEVGKALSEKMKKEDFAPVPKQLAEQLISKLEIHRKSLENEKNIELGFENNFHPEPSDEIVRE